MVDRDLMHRAATCYRRAGQLEKAAQCFRRGGFFRESAAVWESLDALGEAATDLAEAGMPVRGAWVLVHRLGAPDQARELLERPRDYPPSPEGVWTPRPPALTQQRADRERLTHRLVTARCDVADAGDRVTPSALEVLDDVMVALADASRLDDGVEVEEFAVALSTAMARPDLVALVYAAAVRGRRPGAQHRWGTWSTEEFGMPLVLPEPLLGGAG